jgi:hypothetical protein
MSTVDAFSSIVVDLHLQLTFGLTLSYKYDIGDRIHVSQVDTDTNVNGSMSKFSSLFYGWFAAVICLNFVI